MKTKKKNQNFKSTKEQLGTSEKCLRFSKNIKSNNKYHIQILVYSFVMNFLTLFTCIFQNHYIVTKLDFQPAP